MAAQNVNHFIKLCLPISMAVFLFSITSLIAQTNEIKVFEKPGFKHNIGFQANPYFDKNSFDNLLRFNVKHILWVSALRYSHPISSLPRLFLGAETYLYYWDSQFLKSYQINIGPLIRYEIYSFKRMGFLGEFSPSLNYINASFRSTNTQPGLPFEDVSEFCFGYYIAPVISLNSKNSRWSCDLSWKFSGKHLGSGKKSAPSFKIGYHF